MVILGFAAALILAVSTSADAETPGEFQLAPALPRVATQGAFVDPQGDYMTTPDGCTYRRTKAPGHPVRWIIVQNPHHIGRVPSPRRCKGML